MCFLIADNYELSKTLQCFIDGHNLGLGSLSQNISNNYLKLKREIATVVVGAS